MAPHAANAAVGTEADLATALGNGPGTVTLSNDITVNAASIAVASTVTLDLAGFTLHTQNITLNSGVTFTIEDSSSPSTGSLTTVPAGPNSAGITTTGASLVIDGGTITATGGSNGGAGIGGNNGGRQDAGWACTTAMR